MGERPRTMSASVCFRLLPMAMLMAVLHTSNATSYNDDYQTYAAWLRHENSQSTSHSSIEADTNVQNANPTSANDNDVDDDNLVYAEWLKQENSKSKILNWLPRVVNRRSGAGSGSGSGSGATSVPSVAPTVAPSEAYVASGTDVDPAAATVQIVTQTVQVTMPDGPASYIGTTKQSFECAYGVKVTIMRQASNGTCYNNEGNDLRSAATDGRRSAVTITFTILVDSAISEQTLTAIVATADAVTATELTAAVTATIAANPAFAGATAPTIVSIQLVQQTEEESEDSLSVVVIAIIICCGVLVIAVSIVVFLWHGGYACYEKTQKSDSDPWSEHVQSDHVQEEAHSTETILVQQPAYELPVQTDDVPELLSVQPAEDSRGCC